MNSNVSQLRFATAGSVDDGKSTLIGRLLYDAKALLQDQVAALDANFDLAALTDGLRAEREQGITIDVAYRYFSTPRRRFIIADCPGHTEYTRNALTGMSTADVVLLLVDARHGAREQTRRHAALASLLGLEVIICVNKMDALGHRQTQFEAIERQTREALAPLELPRLHVLPISALSGANVVHPSPELGWFEGPTLLALLESLEPHRETPRGGRMYVQGTLRGPNGERLYAGSVAEGRLEVGQSVALLPSGLRTRIAAIDTFDGPLESAEAPAAVSLRFTDELDVGRGDLVATGDDAPALRSTWSVTLAWMADRPLTSGSTWLLQVGSALTPVRAETVDGRLGWSELEAEPAESLGKNDVGQVSLRSARPLPLEAAAGGAGPTARFILIDPNDKSTAAAGLVAPRWNPIVAPS